jgi:hypothetical protein
VIHLGIVLETGIGVAVDDTSRMRVWEMAKEMNVAPPTARDMQEDCATGIVAALDPALDGLFLMIPLHICRKASLMPMRKQANPELIN